jgi:2,4-diketo-3-deoxy-L-fuconate hydrolase
LILRNGAFAIGTFCAAGGRPFPGLVFGSAVVDLRAHLGEGLTTARLFDDWEASLAALRALAATAAYEGAHDFDALRALPPVDPPGQLFCAGANYHRHLHEIVMSMGRDADGGRSETDLRADADDALRERIESGTPFVFSVQPSALSGARDDVVLWGPGRQHDWELELAVVIGRRAWNVAEEDALGHVAGYTIANDISTRDVMYRPNFAMTDFLMTKGRPTFKPLGPYVVPREFVPDYRELRITLSVNGETMQDEGVDDIIYGV